MKKIQQKYRIQSEINIIPFLDVLLILLVIVMIIPSKLIQGFEVNLPDSTTNTINTINHNQSPLIIEIVTMGLYNIIFNDEYINNIYIDRLNLEIRNKIHINPNLICLLAASKTEKYDEIIKVLDLLKNIGVHSVGMITNPYNPLN